MMDDKILEFKVIEPQNIREQIIDCAFNHIENMYVLRMLKSDMKWGEAFGIGGASHPVSWMGNAKGITFHWRSSPEFISIPEIIARAEKWKEKVIKYGQLNLFD